MVSDRSTVIRANLLQYPLLFLSSAFLPIVVLPEWMQVVATYNPVTYGVDAVRALMLGQDVLTVIDVTAFSGVWNTVVPAVAVLGVLGLVLSGIATALLYRVSSSRVSFARERNDYSVRGGDARVHLSGDPHVGAAERKQEFRDKLDKANVNHRTLFPGPDGLATWLTEYYKPIGSNDS